MISCNFNFDLAAYFGFAPTHPDQFFRAIVKQKKG